MFFSLFLFPSYCHSIVCCIVDIFSNGCNQSSFVFFYVDFEPLYRCVNAVFHISKLYNSLPFLGLYKNNWYNLTVRKLFVLRIVTWNSNYSRKIIIGDISTLNGSSLKLVDKFTYLGSSVSSTETVINTRFAKAWTAINRLSVIWKSDLTDKMKRSFFQATVVSILLYGCTTWTLNKRLDKKLDGIYTRMLQAMLNKSWRQHPTQQQLYGHLPHFTKTIKIRQTRHAGHCWRSRNELITDIPLWTPSHGPEEAGRPAKTYIQQLCADTGCILEDLPEAIDDRDGWRERVREIRADGVIGWWRWWL